MPLQTALGNADAPHSQNSNNANNVCTECDAIRSVRTHHNGVPYAM